MIGVSHFKPPNFEDIRSRDREHDQCQLTAVEGRWGISGDVGKFLVAPPRLPFVTREPLPRHTPTVDVGRVEACARRQLQPGFTDTAIANARPAAYTPGAQAMSLLIYNVICPSFSVYVAYMSRKRLGGVRWDST